MAEVIEYFCKCESPEVHIVEWDSRTWGLNEGEHFKECLKCNKIIKEEE